jgi:hypothetical protein
MSYRRWQGARHQVWERFFKSGIYMLPLVGTPSNFARGPHQLRSGLSSKVVLFYAAFRSIANFGMGSTLLFSDKESYKPGIYTSAYPRLFGVRSRRFRPDIAISCDTSA